MQPQNNLVTEIGLIAVSVAIVVGAVVLLALGKIDYAEWAGAIGVVVALWGANSLYKAPSPTQQAQIGAQQSQVLYQQQQLQQLVSYALGMLPGLVQSLSQTQAPVAPPQGQGTAQPAPPVASSGQATQMLATPPEVTLTPALPKTDVVNLPSQPTQTQFKSFTIPDVSAPYPVAGQGIPLGQ